MIVHQESVFKIGFSVNNIHLYLFGQVENTKWMLYSRKIGVNCAKLRYLMYKYIFLVLSETSNRNIASHSQNIMTSRSLLYLSPSNQKTSLLNCTYNLCH